MVWSLGGGTGAMLPRLSSDQDTPKYPCVQCGNVFSYKGNLHKHLRYTCGKGPQFACPLCPQRNKDKWSMQKHILKKHPKCPNLKERLLCAIIST